MGINVFWDNPETKIALVQQYNEPWTMTEYEQMLVETRNAIHSVDHGVYIIGMINDNFTIADGFFTRFASLANRRPENLKGIILVGADSTMRMIHRVFSKVDHPLVRNVHFVANIDDARKIVADASASTK